MSNRSPSVSFGCVSCVSCIRWVRAFGFFPSVGSGRGSSSFLPSTSSRALFPSSLSFHFSSMHHPSVQPPPSTFRYLSPKLLQRGPLSGSSHSSFRSLPLRSLIPSRSFSPFSFLFIQKVLLSSFPPSRLPTVSLLCLSPLARLIPSPFSLSTQLDEIVCRPSPAILPSSFLLLFSHLLSFPLSVSSRSLVY